jgi:hypothetical protein
MQFEFLVMHFLSRRSSVIINSSGRHHPQTSSDKLRPTFGQNSEPRTRAMHARLKEAKVCCDR